MRKILTVAVMLALASAASAAPLTWNGGTGSVNWFGATNWLDGATPSDWPNLSTTAGASSAYFTNAGNTTFNLGATTVNFSTNSTDKSVKFSGGTAPATYTFTNGNVNNFRYVVATDQPVTVIMDGVGLKGTFFGQGSSNLVTVKLRNLNLAETTTTTLNGKSMTYYVETALPSTMAIATGSDSTWYFDRDVTFGALSTDRGTMDLGGKTVTAASWSTSNSANRALTVNNGTLVVGDFNVATPTGAGYWTSRGGSATIIVNGAVTSLNECNRVDFAGGKTLFNGTTTAGKENDNWIVAAGAIIGGTGSLAFDADAALTINGGLEVGAADALNVTGNVVLGSAAKLYLVGALANGDVLTYSSLTGTFAEVYLNGVLTDAQTVGLTYGANALSVVPEPATMALLAIGGVAALIRRRK